MAKHQLDGKAGQLKHVSAFATSTCSTLESRRVVGVAHRLRLSSPTKSNSQITFSPFSALGNETAAHRLRQSGKRNIPTAKPQFKVDSGRRPTLCFQVASCSVDQLGVVEFETGHGTEARLAGTSLTVKRRAPPRTLALLLLFLLPRLGAARRVLPFLLRLVPLRPSPLGLLLVFLRPLPPRLRAHLAVGVGLPLAQEVAAG